MIKSLSLTSLLLLATISPSWAVEVANVDIPNKIQTIKNELDLKGAGVREKFFVDLYVAGLYLPSERKSQNKLDGVEISKSDEHMAIKLHIISKLITSERMVETTREGFNKSIGQDWGELSATINDFISVFSDEIQLNDVYDLVYEKGVGTKVFKNGKLAKKIPGLDFKTALFGVWLSDQPVQKSLKKKMLGS